MLGQAARQLQDRLTVNGKGRRVVGGDEDSHVGARAPSRCGELVQVELEEGPRLTTNLLECPVTDVKIGMPVDVAFARADAAR